MTTASVSLLRTWRLVDGFLPGAPVGSVIRIVEDGGTYRVLTSAGQMASMVTSTTVVEQQPDGRLLVRNREADVRLALEPTDEQITIPADVGKGDVDQEPSPRRWWDPLVPAAGLSFVMTGLTLLALTQGDASSLLSAAQLMVALLAVLPILSLIALARHDERWLAKALLGVWLGMVLPGAIFIVFAVLVVLIVIGSM